MGAPICVYTVEILFCTFLRPFVVAFAAGGHLEHHYQETVQGHTMLQVGSPTVGGRGATTRLLPCA
jgi:hypothetical protein